MAGEFDGLIVNTLRHMEQRLRTVTGKHPFNALYGPWEGGIPASALTTRDCNVSARLAAFNIRGGFGRKGASELNQDEVFGLTSKLYAKGIALAIISESRLGPGMLWPEKECGYRVYGERSVRPDTVVALVLNEMAGTIVQVGEVGEPSKGNLAGHRCNGRGAVGIGRVSASEGGTRYRTVGILERAGQGVPSVALAAKVSGL